MLNQKNLLRDVLKKLIVSDGFLTDNIISVYIYGSFITNELTKTSDIDCLIIAKEVSPELIVKIKLLKTAVEKAVSREFFINISVGDDFSTENFSKGFFTHRERPYYFLFELKNNFELFYGSDFVSQINFPEMLELRVKKECVRLMKNLEYINNKLLINSETNLYSKDTAFKNILFAVKIFQIFFEYSFSNYEDSCVLASRILNSEIPLIVYNYIKKSNRTLDDVPINLAESLVFYKTAIQFMTEKMLSDKKIKGCLMLNDCLGYFSAKQETISSSEKVDVIIFLNGMPRPAQTKEMTDYFIDSGYLFINLYYPGYWEAPGTMNFSELGSKIVSFAEMIKEGKFFDLFSRKDLSFNIGKIFLIGSSFGASVALVAQNNIFSKIVAVSPLVDFSGHKETIDNLLDKLVFFKEVVRLSDYNQIRENFLILDQKSQELRISPEKILLIADKFDKQIHFSSVQEYADKNKVSILSTENGAHGYKIIKQDNIFEKLFKFIKK